MINVAAILLLLISTSSTVSGTDNLVNSVCEKATVAYDDCVVALNQDSRAGTINDIRALTFLSLDLAIANSSEAMGYVRGMVENADPSVQDVLATCSDLLYGSFSDFNRAVTDLIAGDAMYANYDVFVANDGQSNCRRAMEEANVSIPAVLTRCNNVEFFVQICFATTEMLQTPP